MSLSISKLLDLAGGKEKDPLDNRNPDLPVRYDKVKGIKKSSNKTQTYEPYDYDQYNTIMKPSREDQYNVTNLYLNIKSKPGVKQPFTTSEGWFEPAQRRREYDPNAAPPFDFVFGSEDQEFGTTKSELGSKNNAGLVKQAHVNYMNYLNRYNVPTIPVSIQK